MHRTEASAGIQCGINRQGLFSPWHEFPGELGFLATGFAKKKTAKGGTTFP